MYIACIILVNGSDSMWLLILPPTLAFRMDSSSLIKLGRLFCIDSIATNRDHVFELLAPVFQTRWDASKGLRGKRDESQCCPN